MKKQKLTYYEVPKINTIKDMINLAVKEAGNNIAFEYKDKETKNIIKVKYKEFQDDINRLGTALTTINMNDKHIAVIGENSYEWITVYLTALQSNGVFIPIDKELTYKEIVYILKNSDSEVLFFSKKYEKHINQLKDDLPKVEYFIGFDNEKDNGNILSYRIFMEKGRKELQKGNKEYINIIHEDTNE